MIFNLSNYQRADSVFMQDNSSVEDSIKAIKSGRAFVETDVSLAEKFIAYPNGFTFNNSYITGVLNYTVYGTWVDQTYGGAVYATNLTLTANNIRLQAISDKVTKIRFVIQKYA